MSRNSKAKGSRYEREFVELVRTSGHAAERVPLSGAMAGYPDDVVINGSVRVECKFRKDGAGFSRLHTWHPGPGHVLELTESNLCVYSLDDWLERLRCEKLELAHTSSSVTPQQTLLRWLGEAHALAVRRTRAPWLVCEPKEEK